MQVTVERRLWSSVDQRANTLRASNMRCRIDACFFTGNRFVPNVSSRFAASFSGCSVKSSEGRRCRITCDNTLCDKNVRTFGACERLHTALHCTALQYTRATFAAGCCAAPPLARRRGRCIARPRGSRCRPPSRPTAAAPWRRPAHCRGVECGTGPRHAEGCGQHNGCPSGRRPSLCALD